MTRYKATAAPNVKVIVVDDEPAITDFIDETLTENGYLVQSYCDPAEALSAIKAKQFELALIDINMPGISGVDLSREIAGLAPETEIIIITGVPEEKNLDPCLQMGLTLFLFKPFNESQLVYTVYAALHYNRLRQEFHSISKASVKGSGLVGVSEATRELRSEIAMLADTELPVLILGESGTGKEIVARDIHVNSSRHSAPFIPVNCAVLGTLAETELFGHVKGAFTGAAQNTSGYIGAADGGTLFFDEVGELGREIQAKLLRFLDNGEYNRVGEARVKKANVRIVAATNRNIEKMCRDGSFREDLYYRLNGGRIQTTPLASRKADILPLIWHFLELFGSAQKTSYEISADAASLIMESEWPGNVRQLKQTLHRLAQMSNNRKISLSDVRRVLGSEDTHTTLTYKEAKEKAIYEFDREYLLTTLSMAQGSLKKALEISGMHKKNFYAKIKNLGLSMKEFSAK